MEQNNLLHRLARQFGLARDKSSMTAEMLDEATIRHWLMDWLAGRLKLAATKIDPSQSFADYGLDSIVAIQAAGELEVLVGKRLSPALLFEYPSINELAGFLANGLHSESGGVALADLPPPLELSRK